MNSPSPGRLPGGGRPAASHAFTVWFLRVRWGAFCQRTSNRFSGNAVSFSFACKSRSQYRGWTAALRDDDIYATVLGARGISSRPDGVYHNCSSGLCARDERGGIAPKKGDDRDALIEADRQALFLRKLQVEVDTKGPRGESPRFSNLPPRGVDVGTRRKHAESPLHCSRRTPGWAEPHHLWEPERSEDRSRGDRKEPS
jgi:hypothetical protein